MSDEELKKWENKYRLWKILNNVKKPGGCYNCIYHPSSCFKYYPKEFVKMAKREPVSIALIDWEGIEVQEVNWLNMNAAAHCLEWLKYV